MEWFLDKWKLREGFAGRHTEDLLKGVLQAEKKWWEVTWWKVRLQEGKSTADVLLS